MRIYYYIWSIFLVSTNPTVACCVVNNLICLELNFCEEKNVSSGLPTCLASKLVEKVLVIFCIIIVFLEHIRRTRSKFYKYLLQVVLSCRPLLEQQFNECV